MERSTILLLGQRIRPTRTLESGYHFKYPELENCLEELLTDVTTNTIDDRGMGDVRSN